MKTSFKIVLLGMTSATIITSATAQVDPALNDGSFYGSKSQSQIAARTALLKGDIVTIVISEQSAAQFSASTTTTKKDTNSTDQTQSGVLNWLKLPFVSALTAPNSSAANSSVAGAGTTTGSTAFTARISAVVKEVMPNGNLVIEGTRDLKINKESHTIVISGIIRRDDVKPDNTVLSENLAMAEIRSYGTGGAIAERQRKGFLTRILDWLF